MSDSQPSAALPFSARLAGMTLDGGWRVDRRLDRKADPDATGGYFSDSYVVSGPDGVAGFLKALDFSSALEDPEPTRQLERLTRAFNFECDLLARCGARGMSRVVRAIATGTARVDPANLLGAVPYIIFEIADGDVRSALSAADELDVAWRLRSLHHVATGLFQLHKAGVAHQDVKPSNILVFEDRTVSKVADLGRAAIQGTAAPHEDSVCAGDSAYSPPELLYGHAVPEWELRRIGCDVYHLGSMAVFLFTRSSMTALLLAGLPPEMRWPKSRPPFAEVLPYLRSAFAVAVTAFGESVPKAIRTDMVAAVRELCDPDPALRGSPSRPLRSVGSLVMERYISIFNRLAGVSELRMAPRKG